MNEIAEYERRISEALSRIAYGLETLQAQNAEAAQTIVAQQTWATQSSGVDAVAEAAPIARAYADESGEGADTQSGESVETLRAAFESERAANQQLSERVRMIREKHEETEAALERKLGKATRLAESATSEIARLKRANADLIDQNAALVAAAGAVEPHLVNLSMQAELEALRAARAAEAIELAELIAALGPLAQDDATAPVTDYEEATDA
ncbi:hypothetical protein [Albirhodobacter sp. R86504]|uniref:hypothetical protein n=1 Tax=Albirhodobacter sp. R86504 TaxID=3093848 RepID=UPI00366F46E1